MRAEQQAGRNAPATEEFEDCLSADRPRLRRMARELGPKGVHVAHVVIDGQIGRGHDDTTLDPAAIAETYWHLHRQPRSAWTFELELRPSVERF